MEPAVTAPIIEFVSFSSDCPDSFAGKLRRFWGSNVLVPHDQSPVDFELTAQQSPRLAIGRVFHPVPCTSRACVEWPTLHIPADSPAEYRVGRRTFEVPVGSALLLAPGHEYTVCVGAGSTLFLHVDPALLSSRLPLGRAGRSRYWAVRSVQVDVAHDCGLDLPREFDVLLQRPAAFPSADRAADFAALEDRVIARLPQSLLDCGGIWSFVPAASLLAERAAQLIESDLMAPITLDGLAGHFQVTGRWLQKCFNARWGVAPMDFVAYRRLALARAHLASPDCHSVTSVATRCGFNHLGRFAGMYRRTYGESPSDTIARVTRRVASSGGSSIAPAAAHRNLVPAAAGTSSARIT